MPEIDKMQLRDDNNFDRILALDMDFERGDKL
mgnify:FL=1